MLPLANKHKFNKVVQVFFIVLFKFLIPIHVSGNDYVEIEKELITNHSHPDLATAVDQDITEMFSPTIPASRLAKVRDSVSGGLRGTVFFVLGYDLASRLRLTSPSNEILSSIYGFSVFIPMAVLGTNAIKYVSRELLLKRKSHLDIIEVSRNPCTYHTKKSLKFFAFIAGVISAPPLTYLTYLKLRELVSWGWVIPAIPTFYVRTALDYYSLVKISSLLSNELRYPIYKIRSSNLNKKALCLHKICEDAQGAIQALSRKEAQKLLDHIKASDNDGGLKSLMLPSSYFERPLTITKKRPLVTVGQWIGAVIGGYGMWVYYPLARESFRSIFSLLGIEADNTIINNLATISTGTASALTAVATHSSVGKFINSLYIRTDRRELSIEERRHLFKRKMAAAASSIFAACNAGMQAEVAMEFLDLHETKNQLSLVAAVIASFSTCFWAIDEFILRQLEEGDPKATLLTYIRKIDNQIPTYNLDAINEILRRIQAQIGDESQVTYGSI